MMAIARIAAIPVTPQAIQATACLPMRPLSRKPLSRAPTKGRTGMSQISSFIALPFELRRLIELRGLAQAEQGNQDAKSDRGLARRHRDREDREDLAGQVRKL